MGKASFCTIQDCDERIQSYVSINDLGEESYKAFTTGKSDISENVERLFLCICFDEE